jgi:transglutaminase-like putative cysteine protease
MAPLPNWAKVSEPLPVPEDLRGPLFLRRQDSQMHLDPDGQHIFNASLIKVLDSSALQLGNVSIAWDPAQGQAKVHLVRVHRNGTVRDVLAQTRFEIIRREDQLEAAMLDGRLTAVIKVPDLRVGDELEIAYTLPAQDPTLGDHNVGLMLLAAVPPPGRVNLALTWNKVPEPLIRATPDLTSMLQKDGQSVRIAVDNPAPLNPPKDAPPRFSWQRVLQFSDFGSWEAVSSKLAPLFVKAANLGSGSPVKREAQAIAAASPDPLARAAAALKLVQQQVRYVYVGLDGGNLKPATADETWQRRYGDCKGKSALLLALLQEFGIPAEVVMVNNADGDDGLDARLPNPFYFDHVLVRAKIAGQTYWLDPTLPHPYRPDTSPALPYRWVLPLAGEGSAIERVAPPVLAKPTLTTLYEIDARAGFDSPAKIRLMVAKRGRDALVEYHQFSSVSDSQLESLVRQGQEGGDTWTTIEKVNWRFDPQELASVLEIVGTGPVEWDVMSKDSRSLELPGGGFSPPDRRSRPAGSDPTVPFYRAAEFDCRITTVRLPADKPEKEWSFNAAFDQTLFGTTYRRRFDRRDGAIRMVRALRVFEPEISSELAAKDNGRIASFNNSKAVIYYDQGSFDGPPSRDRVPASYEIDWVRQPEACSAPAVTSR